MKKIYIFVLVVAFSKGVMAQETVVDKNEFKHSIATSFGLLSGQAEEIVYYDESSDDKISQLLWDVNLAYVNFNINVDWKKPDANWGLFVDASIKFAFQLGMGVMEDRDWSVGDSNGTWLPDVLSHYSVHNGRTNYGISTNAAIGISFKVFEDFLLRGMIAYDYRIFSWTAMGGSFLYPAADSDDDGDLENGHYYLPDTEYKVGTYNQNWHIISPGISFYGQFNQFFDIDISVKLSPLIWCTAIDEHLLRNLTIEETMDFGLFVEPKLVFSFSPNDSFSLILAVSYTHIAGTRGDSEYKQQGEQSNTYKNIGGGGYNAFDVGLTARFWLIK